MYGRALIVALALCCLVGITTVGLFALRTNNKPPASATIAAQNPMAKIIVASHDLIGGSILNPNDIASTSVDERQVPVGSLRDTPQERTQLVGALLHIGLLKGAIISSTAVVRPGDHSFLSAILDPGMIAVSISVDAVTGLAGMVWPGDRVNLILTHALSGTDDKTLAAETILSGIRVIAVDQNLEHSHTSGSNIRDTRSITLEVTPKNAEAVNIASQMGRLSLAVRAMSDNESTNEVHATLASDVSPAMAHANTNQKHEAAQIHVFNGTREAQ